MFKKTTFVFCFLTFVFSNSQTIEKDSISKTLETVVIESKSKAISFKNGNIKVEVANSVLSSNSNVFDLLSKLPSLQIGSNRESISVIGKGNPILYIDNQVASINDFTSLAVSDIKSIEIINNPSSKYEASGRVVVLITRKLSKKEGFKVDFSENASFKKSFNNYLGINSSIKKGKFEFKTNFNYNYLKPWESNGISTKIESNNFNSNYLAVANTRRPQFIFGAGIFYKINTDDYFSFSLNTRNQKDIFNINTNSFYEDLSTQNAVLTNSSNADKRNFTNSFINYNKKIKKWDAVLFTGLQYSNFLQNVESAIKNNFNKTNFILAQKRDQDYDVNVFSGRIDVEKNFKNDSKLEFGLFNLRATAQTNLMITNFQTNKNVALLYNFNEKNTAVYSQFSGKISKVNYVFGIRAENTNAKGKFENANDFLIAKNYTTIFPKAQFEIPLDITKTINLNYSKSIVRPNYSATSQGSTYINPYFIFTNNINLNPTFTDDVTLNLQRKNKSVALRFFKTKYPVFYSFTFDNVLNTVVFKPTNFDKNTGASLEFSLPFEYKFWSLNAVFSSTINKIEDKFVQSFKTKPWFYFYCNQTFKLPKEYSLDINNWATTATNEGAFERGGIFITNISLTKKFFKHWNLTINWNDVFKEMNFQEKLIVNQINTNANYYTDANELSININYTFGKIKNSSFQEKQVDENTSRIR